MSSKRLGLTLTLVAALALTACTSSGATDSSVREAPLAPAAAELLPEGINESGVLRIAASYQTAPMTMLLNDGQDKAGISFALAREVAKQLGVVPDFSVVPFPGQVAALAADKIDLVWDTTSVTPERLQAATFIQFADITYGLLVKKGNPAGLTDFESMCGRNIALPQGSIFPEYVDAASAACVKSGSAAINTLTFKGEDEARVAVRSGNADGLMSGHPGNSYVAQTADDGAAFEAVELAEIESTPIGIQLKKDNLQLANAIVEAVKAMIEDGSYAAVFDEYDLASMQIDSISVME